MKNNIFRYERKFFITSITKAEIEKLVMFHPANFSEVFYERSINNIYFDTPMFKSYFDNIDGNSDRTKVRIRWYGELYDNIKKPTLELKIKNGILGHKLHFLLKPLNTTTQLNKLDIVQLTSNVDIPQHILAKIKVLTPTLLNRYNRKYFLSADKRFRITIDTNQVFYKICSINRYFLNRCRDNSSIVLELKYDRNADKDASYITESIPFRLTKSSKYVRGIEKLYL
tara:strand:+ start:563 stop:1243 length:681 start_codon:yes stop_codon:yes gene_type:complete